MIFCLSGFYGRSAHLGGLVGGSAAMFVLGPRYVRRHGLYDNQPLLPLFRDSMP